jgi:hypothetical protein
VKVPQELPYAMSVEGLGLRPALATRAMALRCAPPAAGIDVLDQDAALASVEFDPADCRQLRYTRSIRGSVPRPVRLGGRVTLDRDGSIVVEVDLVAPLAWDPPEEVSLVFADGSVKTAHVIGGLSTGARRLEAGQTLRLVLACETGAATDLERVELLVEAKSVTISFPWSGQKARRGGHRPTPRKE